MSRGWWFLVTGTGRCGTGYIAHVLSSAGIRCSHEGIFSPHKNADGIRMPPGLATDEEIMYRVRTRMANPAWSWQAESSWLAAPYLDREELQGLTVVHLVRSPKPTIDSMCRQGGLGYQHIGGLYFQFSARYEPEALGIEDPGARMAHYYTQWNKRIEPYADIRWRVEDDVQGLLDLLGIDYQGRDLFSNTRYNSRVGYFESDVSLAELPEPIRGNLREMTERYGYEWPA